MRRGETCLHAEVFGMRGSSAWPRKASRDQKETVLAAPPNHPSVSALSAERSPLTSTVAAFAAALSAADEFKPPALRADAST
jgi:hypothetical protein